MFKLTMVCSNFPIYTQGAQLVIKVLNDVVTLTFHEQTFRVMKTRVVVLAIIRHERTK